ncbi:type I-E CRISPR-associated protein Cas6/Cse3/CasE [Limnobaculum zhutongyuii]|uniref:Type I-E CRISPR-associated protein Cas6/Cse3/CasE n=1 Tax=Limnobaculum zhutongyuii TaxID=2498113 RepID=A0A411WKU3_9GAMM|nr:type I-E CRISPR-associated protein Cas6/Cse3/CasE [Limnobaculum zhutongyuii]QBH96770.1 type I-E CRISPR-associated protein Cas6/Cse3/CasE [Limnobaculum zhutongyuii]TQS90199.1 type I-E CRISPR-associated protein Cas6/Cse3/CasE [Limnobaculum zhutongyuii]
MFFSRVKLDLSLLDQPMWQKWLTAQPYASHQWLWQLFPQNDKRQFLFRHQASLSGAFFYVLSEQSPETHHNIFQIETKLFNPQLAVGMKLFFSLRANPVVTRGGKRSDILMDAKYHAKKQGIDREEWKPIQEAAALQWLKMQGERKGFQLNSDNCHVINYQQQKFVKPQCHKSIAFGSVDFEGELTVMEPALFQQMLIEGLGKSRSLGCGLMLIRRG